MAADKFGVPYWRMFMPHRRKPSAIARNILHKYAFFDVKTRESINQITASALIAAVAAEYPKANPKTLEAQVYADLNLTQDAVISGLVLSDPRGTGALH